VSQRGYFYSGNSKQIEFLVPLWQLIKISSLTQGRKDQMQEVFPEAKIKGCERHVVRASPPAGSSTLLVREGFFHREISPISICPKLFFGE